jgi:hypothetical protein
MLLKVAAGWHMHLDVLAADSAGDRRPAFWEGWSRLQRDYEQRLAG